jgi:hypothetical protein
VSANKTSQLRRAGAPAFPRLEPKLRLVKNSDERPRPEAGPGADDRGRTRSGFRVCPDRRGLFISLVRPLTAADEEVQQYRAYKPITVEGQPLSEVII